MQTRDARAVAKLQALVRIPTVSRRDPDLVDTGAFDDLLAELGRQFPLLHERLELLMAHLDVVPVDEEAPWQHPPFGADLVDGQVWGRGTLDDKGCLVAICEAVETLLERDVTPAQDVWLSFGCDEEVMGQAAPQAVAELVRRGVRPWFV